MACHRVGNHDEKDADHVLNREGEGHAVDARHFQDSQFILESHIEVHFVQVSDCFASRTDNDPIDNPVVLKQSNTNQSVKMHGLII